MQIDVPRPFRLPGHVFRQSGSLVVAFDSEVKDSYRKQPMLFIWAPGRQSYADSFFQTIGEQSASWKEVRYSIDQLIDHLEVDSDDSRIRRITNWIQSSWAEMKTELLQSSQPPGQSASSSDIQFGSRANSFEPSGYSLLGFELINHN
jgi:hypothetical protein